MALGQITITDMTDREAICVPGTIFVPVDTDGILQNSKNGNFRNFKISIRQGSQIIDDEIGIVEGTLIYADGIEEDRPFTINLTSKTLNWVPEKQLSQQTYVSFQVIYKDKYIFNVNLMIVPDATGQGAYVEKIVRYYYVKDTTDIPTETPSVSDLAISYSDESGWSYNSSVMYNTGATDENGLIILAPEWDSQSRYNEQPYYFELYLYSDHTTAQISDIYYDRALAQGQTNSSSIELFQNDLKDFQGNYNSFLGWLSGKESDLNTEFAIGEDIIKLISSKVEVTSQVTSLVTELLQAYVGDGNGFGTVFQQTGSFVGWAVLNAIGNGLMTFDNQGLHISNSNSRYSVLVADDGVYIQRRNDEKRSDGENSYITQSRFRKQQLTIPDIRIAYPSTVVGDTTNNNEDSVKHINMQLAPDGGMMMVVENAVSDILAPAITTNGGDNGGN